jgi:hypothetical protein
VLASIGRVNAEVWGDEYRVVREALDWAARRVVRETDPKTTARSASELRQAAGTTVCPAGIGGEAALRVFVDVLEPAHAVAGAVMAHGRIVLIVIERGDEHFPPMCLDASRLGPDGEFPVVGFWLTSRTVSTDSYTTFAEYLEHSLATSLEAIQDERP